MRGVLEERYHHRHPFHRRMHEGSLAREELQDWVANRYHYQAQMPVKDAIILSRLPTRAARRVWIGRIVDQDGSGGDEGGLEQWLRLADAVGLRREDVESGTQVVPGVRLAVDAYLRFCSVRPWPEAVAASLTQLFVPDLMRVRSEALARHYGLTAEGLTYFSRHSDVAARESEQAITLLLTELRSREEQDRALDAVRFKCDVLNALLDAVEAIR
ncbi:MAG: pyrroloquinoline-quinone synthase PqqC [Pseudonocardiales bacterium]|nr:pyrroloquinoline-quinone synthase PqqC [Pseudonocardiales bacterium]